MRYLSTISFTICLLHGFGMEQLFSSKEASLHIDQNFNYQYALNQSPSEQLFTGEAVKQNDTLFLLGPKYGSDNILRAVYVQQGNFLSLVTISEEELWATSLALKTSTDSTFTRQYTYFGTLPEESLQITRTYNKEGVILSVEQVFEGELHGMQATFAEGNPGIPLEVTYYANGLLSANSYKFKSTKRAACQLIEITKYKKGKVKKVKRLEVPPVFYTSHFWQLSQCDYPALLSYPLPLL